MKVKNNHSKMRAHFLLSIILPVFSNCQQAGSQPDALVTKVAPVEESSVYYRDVKSIPLPEGYSRISEPEGSFGNWLRQLSLKKDNRVYLYNGQLKKNQSAQFAVLNIPVGNKDLQQCADAVMRLRASWLYQQRRFGDIVFSDNNGKKYQAGHQMDSAQLESYLEKVFAFCGTASLEKQLRRVPDYNRIKAGDVLIKGGSPGHAVLVMDVAADQQGRRIYLLAQSYMPAQNIHILLNPMDTEGSPWYHANVDNFLIHTPEWTFTKQELRQW